MAPSCAGLCSAEVVCVSSWGSTLTPAFGTHEWQKVRKAIPSLVVVVVADAAATAQSRSQHAMPLGTPVRVRDLSCLLTAVFGTTEQTAFHGARGPSLLVPHAVHVTVGMANFLTISWII